MQRNADIQKMLRLFGKILVQSKSILRIPATECLFSIFFIQMQLHFYLVDGADPNVLFTLSDKHLKNRDKIAARKTLELRSRFRNLKISFTNL